MLLASLGSSRHVDLATGVIQSGNLMWYWDRPLLITMLDGVGEAITPLLLEALDIGPHVDIVRKSVPEMLSVLPSDAAFQGLVDRVDLTDHTGREIVRPALLDAMRRFPVRALRLVAPAASGSPQLGALLTEHVQANRDVVAEALPGLTPEVRAVVASLLDGGDALPDAPPDALPPLLIDPPWTRTTKAAKRGTVSGLTPPAPAMRWAPGERDEWSRPAGWHDKPEGMDWDEYADDLISRGSTHVAMPSLILNCSEEKARSLAPLREPDGRVAKYCARQMAARFELEGLPAAMSAAQADPAADAGLLMPFLDADVARLMADYLPRRAKGRRKAALAWFDRHGLDAVPLLVPDAVGTPGTRRRDAEKVLRLLATKHPPEEIVEAVARAHGDEAARAVEALLAVDELELLPARIPSVGTWANPRSLSRPSRSAPRRRSRRSPTGWG